MSRSTPHKSRDEATRLDSEAQNPIEIIAENEETFRAIVEEVEDAHVREKFGEQPLELLERARERGYQT